MKIDKQSLRIAPSCRDIILIGRVDKELSDKGDLLNVQFVQFQRVTLGHYNQLPPSTRITWPVT